jgi:serine/threonine protein kinase
MFSCLFGSCFKRTKNMVLTVDELLNATEPAMGGANDIQRYKSIRKIGTGGFAKVWKAIDTHTKEYVAMKVSSSSYTNNVLEKEFFILRKLNSPHIISPIAFYYDRRALTTTHMIIPFMKKDLYTHAVEEKRYMSEEELRKLVIDIANAIKHVHELDLVHRDIKPENILIDDNGNYVLCDFGHAEHDNSVSLEGLKGSLFYMAPEVASAHVKKNRNTIPFSIGKPIDIFSFGMTLHNVATLSMGGANPSNKLEINYIDEISRFDMMPQVDDLTDRSDTFRDLLKMMLYRSPIARITVEEILEHPFVTGKDAILTSGPM